MLIKKLTIGFIALTVSQNCFAGYYCEALCGGLDRLVRIKYIAKPVWGEGSSRTQAFNRMKKSCKRYDKTYILHKGFKTRVVQGNRVTAATLREAFPSNSCEKE